jgi:hypothetical protein
MGDWLEEFWGDILSEEPLRVLAAFSLLKGEERESVYAHLKTMATEEGWADVQREAARAALNAIDSAGANKDTDKG